MDDRAIVIGAGIAGLTAARVLSRRYARVTLLDRDTLPYDSSPRPGVPQSLHPHILLVAGLADLSALFPGLPEELIALGGTPIDVGAGLCNYRFGRRWPSTPSKLITVSISRPGLEAAIRARVGALPGVAIRDQIAVSGLAGRNDLVTGVVLDTGETLNAALVVDCTGRGSRSDRWLGSLGVDPPAEVAVDVGLSYATRVYRRHPGDLGPWLAAFTRDKSIFGVAVPIEGDRWMVGLGGWHLADPAAFDAIAAHLPDPIIPELVGRAEPLSDVRVARFPTARRRLFDRLDRMPGGYVALGDAVACLDPIHGQGMTSAVRQATVLGKVLDRRHRTADAEMVHDYYAAAAEAIETPWRLAAPSSGRRGWYPRQLALASQIDAEIYRALLGVQHLVDPPSSLRRPGFAARAIRLARNRRREGRLSG